MGKKPGPSQRASLPLENQCKRVLANFYRTEAGLDRLLDPRNVPVTFNTITRAATALRKRVIICVADLKVAKPA